MILNWLRKIKNLLLPDPVPRFRAIKEFFPKESVFNILDVGCGNHSASFTRHYFPNCRYYGVDVVSDYETDESDRLEMEEFLLVGTDGSGYEKLRDNFFDVVMMNHVLEHMENAEEVLQTVLKKTAPGGIIWLAFPSEKSLSLPHADEGCLNFSDDSTHVYLPSVNLLSNLLMKNGFRIIYAGPVRDNYQYLQGMVKNIINKLFVPLGMRLSAKYLWCYMGFETAVFAVKKDPGK